MPEFVPVVGQWGLPGVVLVMVLLGWLVPRSVYRDRIADKDAQILAKDATIASLSRQRDELVELARTTVATFQALQAHADYRAKDSL